MQSKYLLNIVSTIVALTFTATLVPSVTLAAATDSDPLYESRVELESLEVNRDDAQTGFDTSVDELNIAKDNHSAATAQNNQEAARITAEIDRLQKEQIANVKEAKRLADQVKSYNKIAAKNAAAEKKAQRAARIDAAKLDKVAAAFNRAEDRKNKSIQALSDVKAKWARTQQDLTSKSRELAAAKNAEKRSAAALKSEQAQYKKYRAQAAIQMNRMNQQLRAAKSKTAQNERKAQALRQKKALGRLSLN